MARTLPPITPGSDFYGTLRSWQNSLKPLLSIVQPPSVTMTFSAKGVTNGVLLTWGLNTAKANVDGYIIQRSDNGDFSANVTSIAIPSSTQNSYFDNLGSAGVTKYYRILATSGTIQDPQQNQGKPSGVISAASGSGSTTFDASQNGVPAANFPGSFFPQRSINTGGVKGG